MGQCLIVQLPSHLRVADALRARRCNSPSQQVHRRPLLPEERLLPLAPIELLVDLSERAIETAVGARDGIGDTQYWAPIPLEQDAPERLDREEWCSRALPWRRPANDFQQVRAGMAQPFFFPLQEFPQS